MTSIPNLRLIDLTTNTHYVDYHFILTHYEIKKPTLHLWLTQNLTGLEYKNKVIYNEADVTALLASKNISHKKKLL